MKATFAQVLLLGAIYAGCFSTCSRTVVSANSLALGRICRSGAVSLLVTVRAEWYGGFLLCTLATSGFASYTPSQPLPPCRFHFCSKFLSLLLRGFLQYAPTGKILAFIFFFPVLLCGLPSVTFTLWYLTDFRSVQSSKGCSAATAWRQDPPVALGIATGSALPLVVLSPDSIWE